MARIRDLGVNRTPSRPATVGELNEFNSAFSGDFEFVNSNQESTTMTLRSKIENSDIYKSAYNLLSQDQNPIWLQRLESIPASVVGPNSTFLDDAGLTNSYNEKLQAVEAEAYSQIQKLVVEYQKYKQELPVNQVEQFSDAGINSAITGQGIDGASISGDAANRDLSAYSMQGVSPLEGISTIGNLVFSASNGILSAIQVFNQLGVNREQLAQSARSSHWNIQRDLMDLGFSSFPMSSSVEDFDKWWISVGSNEAKSLNIGKSAVNKLRSSLQFYSANRADRQFFERDFDGSVYLSDVGQSIVNKMVDFQLDTWQKTIEYNNVLAEYNNLYQSTLDPVKMAHLSMDSETTQKELLVKQNALQALNNELMNARNNAIKQWIDEAGTDAQARAIIARVIMNVSPTESVQLDDYNTFSGVQRANNYLSPIGNITGIFSNLSK